MFFMNIIFWGLQYCPHTNTQTPTVLAKLLVWFLCTVHLNDSCLVLAIYLRWICIILPCPTALQYCVNMLQLQYNVPLQAALMILLTAQRQAAAGEMSLLAQPEVVQVLQSLVCSDNTASAAASPAAGKFCRSQYLLNLCLLEPFQQLGC